MANGNINLFTRPRVIISTPNGKQTATVRSMSYGDEKGEHLIPTVEQHGRGLLSPEDAIKQSLMSRQTLGTFPTPDAATDYAQRLHSGMEEGIYDVPLASSRKTTNPAALLAAMKSLLASRAAK